MQLSAYERPDAGGATPVAAPPQSLLSAIAAWAAAFPGAVAAEQGAARLTYGDLEAASGRLASQILARGVRAGDTVAVYAPRSLRYIEAALAVMRARACFLPLDPNWPIERAQAVLAASGAALVVGEAGLLAGLGALGAPTLALDAAAAAEAASAAAQAPAPDDLAYLLYTSGSTGAPKGVEIEWSSFQHMVDWKVRCQSLSQADRVSCLASVAFDACLTEIWPTLAAGGTVVIADEASRLSPEALQAWLVAERITVAAFVPPVLAERLITSPWPLDTRLRILMSAGETLRAHPAPGQPFVVLNGYGPTECTVETTVGVTPAGGEGAGLPSIGRAIPDVFVYLLDEHGRPVRDGETGEIHIGGANVGRGYRGQHDLTRERFLPDPFRGQPGARMFRTGDLASRRPDGELAFRGRVDDQVQIRGHRVEPAEVSGALTAHPQVAACAIVSRAGPAGAELIAYVVPNAAAALSSRLLREHLAQKLPAYMIPARFLRLRALPLTPSGKVDRQALPAPESAETLDDTPYRAPSRPAERRIVAIFEEVLKCEGIGVDDDFFLLGGNSLLAAQIAMRASESFGVELPIPALFAARTVAQLAPVIEEALIQAVERMTDDEAERCLAARA